MIVFARQALRESRGVLTYPNDVVCAGVSLSGEILHGLVCQGEILPAQQMHLGRACFPLRNGP